MSKHPVLHKEDYKGSLKYDIAAGSVVFLVALPLCLGIAVASGAPVIAGLVSGIVGGIVVTSISQAQMSVSGPAAGLTAIVLVGIEQVGTFEALLVATIIGGIIQIILGLLRVGAIAIFFPSCVIKGMLAAIGIILIIKEVPIAFGLHDGTWSEFGDFADGVEVENISVFIIFLLSFLILHFWQKSTFLTKMYWLPAPLVAVLVAILIDEFIFTSFFPAWKLNTHNLVNIPNLSDLANIGNMLHSPDWSVLGKSSLWGVALSIGLIASLESLLTVEAVDKIDVYKRKTPLNRELLAQGAGNIAAGLLGGLPITSVIVRSSANINSGGRTKVSSFIHGILLLICTLFLSRFLNMIPMSALAAVLIVIGYKLAHPEIIKSMYRNGLDQFIPFAITIICILIFNLLIGVIIGILVGLVFILVTEFHSPITVSKEDDTHVITFNKDISFLNKGILNDNLESVPEGSKILIDATDAKFVDHDVLELLTEFERESHLKNIKVTYKNLPEFSVHDFIFSAFDKNETYEDLAKSDN